MTIPEATSPSSRPRFRALDGARGVALILLIISHGLQLLTAYHDLPWGFGVVNALFFLTKVSTPMFVWVFGMTMAYVYYDLLSTPQSSSHLKKRLWRRALLVFLSHQFLVIVIETAGGGSLQDILGRLLYIRLGYWIEVLNFYLVILLLSPWLLRLWRTMSLMSRIVVIPSVYFLGLYLAYIPVPEQLHVLKDIITGHPGSDTFPVLQFSSFYLVGLSFGEFLFEKKRAQQISSLYVTTAVIAGACLIGSVVLSDLSLREYVVAVVRDTYKFPAQPPYILLGFSGILIVMLACLWVYEVRKIDHQWARLIELLGRHSLLTFVVQYIILFTVYGLMLRLHNTMHLPGILLNTGVVIASSIVCVWLWEVWNRRRMSS